MKTIQLTIWRNVIAAPGIAPRDVTTIGLIKDCVNNLPNGGITTAEMRMRIKLLEKVEKAKGKTLILEDAEFTELTKCVESTKFTFNNKCFIEFDDAIKEAAKTK